MFVSIAGVRTWYIKFVLIVALSGVAAAPVEAAEPPVFVVTTFSILQDLVEQIGGEHVSVVSLVGPGEDAHVFHPTPAHARLLSRADALFVNGLGFEGWINRLVAASGFRGMRMVVSRGINPIVYRGGPGKSYRQKTSDHSSKKLHNGGELHGEDTREVNEHHRDPDRDRNSNFDHEDFTGRESPDFRREGRWNRRNRFSHASRHRHSATDPHAWHDLENAMVYVENIAVALARLDPENRLDYFRNLLTYLVNLKALDTKARWLIAGLPTENRTVVTSHNAFGYFQRAYGLKFKSPQGLSTGSAASARDVAKLINLVRSEDIHAIFVESIADRRLLEQISRETNAVIGGALYSGALSEADGPAATYLDMFRNNLHTLVDALLPRGSNEDRAERY